MDSDELRPTQRLPPSPQHTSQHRFLRIVWPPIPSASTSKHLRARSSTSDSGELRPTQRLPPSPQHTWQYGITIPQNRASPHPKREHLQARSSMSDSGKLLPRRSASPLARLSIIHTHPSMPPLALRLRVGRHSLVIPIHSQLLGALNSVCTLGLVFHTSWGCVQSRSKTT